MFVGLNKVMLIGCVGRDPEMRYVPTGRPVAAFNLGVPRVWHDSAGAQHDETEWFNVVAWDSLAEVCKARLYKGAYVYLEAELCTRSWEDATGGRCFCIELAAREVIPLSALEHPSPDAGG